MVGILGFGDQANGAGILGGAMQQPQQPDWANKLGLFSAALKDASAQFSGQADPGTLQAWRANQQQQQIRQQLLGALSSQDPAVRQQGYTAASLMGIDTKPFQQQQASQQLPQLLQSMKPSQQTFNSPTASLPGIGTVNPGAINFEAPGLPINDAIAQAPPELQAEYAPKMLDQQISAAQNAIRPATAQEKQALGLDPKTPALIDVNGKISPVTDPNQVTAYQAAELKNQAAGRNFQQQQLAETRRHNQATEGPSLMGGGGEIKPLTAYPPQVQSMVKAMLEGRQAPPTSFALSKPYWQNLIGIANAVDPNFDQSQWAARVSARKDMLGGGKGYQSLNAGNTSIQHLGRLHDQIGDVSGVQLPLIGNLVNSGINAGAKASGLPGVPAYNDTLGHLAEETTKFYRGAGGAEADVTRNMGNLAPELSTAQKQAGTANTVHLIYGKLAPMVEQYNKTMNTNYPTSHFLSKEAVSTIKKMGFDPDSGEALAPAGKPATAASLPRLPSQAKIRVFNPATGRLE